MDTKTIPIYMYVVYKILTSEPETYIGWKWGDGKRRFMQMEIKTKLE